MEPNYNEEVLKHTRAILDEVIRKHASLGNDFINLSSMKFEAAMDSLKTLGFSLDQLLKQFKTHTFIHPKIAQLLMKNGDEDIHCALSQVSVRNEKLARIVKNQMQQDGLKTSEILAIDGLAGNITNGPNFEPKLYIGNLRYAYKDDTIDEEENDFKRLHVQTVREMYKAMRDVPEPSKHVYDILRKCFYDKFKTKLPGIEFDEDESMDGELEGKIANMYMNSMGIENMDNLVKSLRFRGEKRPSKDMDATEENETRDKREREK